MSDEIDHPHDRLFRTVFSDAAEAAGLLQTALPAELRDEIDWSTLNLRDGTFLDEALRGSESDLLYEAAYGKKGESRERRGRGDRRERGGHRGQRGHRDRDDRVWLYLLFEHQSTPDPWMPFRLLKYCCRIWEAEIRDGTRPGELRLIVPVVFYQGRRGWRHSTKFADLFPEAVRGWRWLPGFEHVLVDQTGVGPEGVAGELKGRIAQLLMMAAYGRHTGAALEGAARLLAALFSGGALSYIRPFVLYVLATQEKWGSQAFDEALRRHGREQGGEIMSYAQQLLEEGRAEGWAKGRNQGREEGREEGTQRSKVDVVEGFLRVGVTWDVIEAATGLNETAFRALKERVSASNRSQTE